MDLISTLFHLGMDGNGTHNKNYLQKDIWDMAILVWRDMSMYDYRLGHSIWLQKLKVISS